MATSSTINGSSGNDVLIGTNADEWINGLAGNDSISGGGGNDIVLGGLGLDTLDGGNSTVPGVADSVEILLLILLFNLPNFYLQPPRLS